MDYGFSILMFSFSAGLLLYAGLVALFGVSLIRRHWAVKMKDKKAYARGFARVLALTALAPAASGAVALLGDLDRMILPALLTLIAGIIAAIWIGLRVAGKDFE